jgi:thioredoxin 1
MKASFSSLINAETPVLVDFYADWCAPCKALAPILKQLKEQVGDRLRIVKIDVDHNNAIAGKFQVRGVPTLVLFKEGKAVWRQSGVMPVDAILQGIRPFL